MIRFLLFNLSYSFFIVMTSRSVKKERPIAKSSQISTTNFYGRKSSRVKIGIGEYGIEKVEVETGIEMLNASSDSESESEEEIVRCSRMPNLIF